MLASTKSIGMHPTTNESWRCAWSTLLDRQVVMRLGILTSLLLPLIMGIPCAVGQTGDATDLKPDSEIEEVLKVYSDLDKVPGIVAAIATQGKPLRIAASGIRRAGRRPELQIDSVMHLGSCTKAMTATLVGCLVDEGKLDFQGTIAQQLPELSDSIHPDYRDVTLLQCLRHTSGMPANANNWWMNHRQKTTIQKKRFDIAVDSLARPPKHPAGTHYEYSNLGYMIAGMMIERATNQSWEEAMRERLFRPLGLTQAGFGIPGRKDSLVQPWGHTIGNDGQWVSRQGDNAPALGPAGTAHMPVSQWSRFTLFAAQGYQISKGRQPGQPPAVKISQATWKQLFETAVIGDQDTKYACGWSVVERPWADGIAINHSGSNTMWYCVVWSAPSRGKSYLVAMNIAGGETPKIADQLVFRLIQLDRP